MATGLPARVVLVCAVLATVSIAHAERRPVAVIDLSGDPRGEALANELYLELVNHLDLRSIDQASFMRSLTGPFSDEDRPSIEAARRAKHEAEEFLVQLNNSSAEAAAERGTLALLNVRPSPEVLGLYAELAFASGQAALELRKPNDASLSFGLSHRLDPAKRPDPTRYRPAVIEAYQLATTKPPAAAKLEVKSTGSVWIDGIERGPGPGTFDVSEGLHLVQLTGGGRETRGKLVSVPGVTQVEIEPAPASDERRVERARIELARTKDAAARAGAVKKLAQLLGVGDAVLIEKTADDKLMVQTWRDRAPGFSALVEHEQGKTPELLAPLSPPRKPQPAKQPSIIPEQPPMVDPPLYKRRWFQGALATGILAVAATIFIVSTQDVMITVDGDIKPAGE